MFKKSPATSVQVEIDRLHRILANLTPHTDEYSATTDQLSKLYTLQTNKSDRLSKDTLALVAGNLAGIVMILGHERAHVIASKALAFVIKAR